MRAPIKSFVPALIMMLGCAGLDASAAQLSASGMVFGAPILPPFAHTRFCLAYPAECKVRAVLFRGGAIALKPQRTNESIADEKWLIAPAFGDCNDYAVTKRHQLLARGWPARVLLLAEVVIPSGEHHLVLVVRMREGDLVADNLDLTIRPWTATRYR